MRSLDAVGTALLVVIAVLGRADQASTAAAAASSDETPSWEELDARPLAAWYDEAKFGIFIHWGAFSVPAYADALLWGYPDVFDKYRNATERPNFSYQEYAARFKAELYRPEEWAKIFAQSGAQYVVPVAKHCDGYSNWNSKDVPATWNWNVMDIGPKRDVFGDLAAEVKKQTSPQTGKRLKLGVYHCLFEWYNPLYLADVASNYTTQQFVDQKTLPSLYDLVHKYEPELIWSDGEWGGTSTYWKTRDFVAWYATHSTVAKTAVWNDRWGDDTQCNHGAYWTCVDRYNPDTLQTKKYENALTIDSTSWGWNRSATIDQYLTVTELIHILIQTVALNGNVLLNVGPGADGTISPIFVDRLLGMGDWLSVNGEAIYGTRPWNVSQNETESSVFYTTKGDRLYAHFTQWPGENLLTLQFPKVTPDTTVRFLGLERTESVEWRVLDKPPNTATTKRKLSDGGIQIVLPALTPNLIPCQHAWVLVLTGLANVQ